MSAPVWPVAAPVITQRFGPYYQALDVDVLKELRETARNSPTP